MDLLRFADPAIRGRSAATRCRSGTMVGVRIVRCALGVVQKRGHKVIHPAVVTIGANEMDYLARHVEKVRGTVAAGGRSLFRLRAQTPSLVTTLQSSSTSDAHFASTARSLQDALARTMKTSTNAKDCVFAIVLAEDTPGDPVHVSLLKLDAVVEAAQMRLLANQGVSFKVLRELLPEPGKLQKALSWPDPRPSSDVIMLDTNFTTAQYFENAYEVLVSPKSVDAEEELLRIVRDRVPPTDFPEAVAEAAELSGPLDEVLTTLAENYPSLAPAATAVSTADRPAGIVRKHKIAARHIVWKAEGMELRVSPEVAPSVTTTQTPLGGWITTIETRDQPLPDAPGS